MSYSSLIQNYINEKYTRPPNWADPCDKCGPFPYLPTPCGPCGVPAPCGPCGVPAPCGPCGVPNACGPCGVPAPCGPCGVPAPCGPCGVPNVGAPCGPCGVPNACGPCGVPNVGAPCGPCGAPDSCQQESTSCSKKKCRKTKCKKKCINVSYKNPCDPCNTCAFDIASCYEPAPCIIPPPPLPYDPCNYPWMRYWPWSIRSWGNCRY